MAEFRMTYELEKVEDAVQVVDLLDRLALKLCIKSRGHELLDPGDTLVIEVKRQEVRVEG